MKDLVIREHALKHGLKAEDIAYAWDHFIVMQFRDAPNEGEIVAIGFDASGNAIEMVAVETVRGIIIFHAMRPPSHGVLRELGLEQAW